MKFAITLKTNGAEHSVFLQLFKKFSVFTECSSPPAQYAAALFNSG
jgi:hypothetical protein